MIRPRPAFCRPARRRRTGSRSLQVPASGRSDFLLRRRATRCDRRQLPDTCRRVNMPSERTQPVFPVNPADLAPARLRRQRPHAPIFAARREGAAVGREGQCGDPRLVAAERPQLATAGDVPEDDRHRPVSDSARRRPNRRAACRRAKTPARGRPPPWSGRAGVATSCAGRRVPELRLARIGLGTSAPSPEAGRRANRRRLACRVPRPSAASHGVDGGRSHALRPPVLPRPPPDCAESIRQKCRKMPCLIASLGDSSTTPRLSSRCPGFTSNDWLVLLTSLP